MQTRSRAKCELLAAARSRKKIGKNLKNKNEFQERVGIFKIFRMEVFVYGETAVAACAAMRPAALREIFLDENARGNAERAFPVPVKRVPGEMLASLAGTREHGGIVARTERPEPAQIRPAMRDEWRAAGEKILFLDGISDAEQLAAILRIAVICGVSRLIADEQVCVPALYSSRVWSASGGAAESLKFYRTESMPGMVRMMSEKFFVIGFVREGGRRINYAKVPVFPGRTTALYLSADPNGVPAKMISRCGYLLHVPERANCALRFSPSDLAALALPWLAKTSS